MLYINNSRTQLYPGGFAEPMFVYPGLLAAPHCVSSIFAFLKSFGTFCSSKLQLSVICQTTHSTEWLPSEPGGFTQFPHKVSWNIIHQENYTTRTFHSVSLIKDFHDLFNHWLTRSGVFDLCLHPLGSQRFQPYMRGSVQGPAALWLMLRENRGNWAWDAFKGRFIPLLCVLNPLIVQ